MRAAPELPCHHPPLRRATVAAPVVDLHQRTITAGHGTSSSTTAPIPCESSSSRSPAHLLHLRVGRPRLPSPRQVPPPALLLSSSTTSATSCRPLRSAGPPELHPTVRPHPRHQVTPSASSISFLLFLSSSPLTLCPGAPRTMEARWSWPLLPRYHQPLTWPARVGSSPPALPRPSPAAQTTDPAGSRAAAAPAPSASPLLQAGERALASYAPGPPAALTPHQSPATSPILARWPNSGFVLEL